MTKKDYIMIADVLRPIAHDCGTERGYIKNECGPSGGKIK